MFGASFIQTFSMLFTENKQKISLHGEIQSAQKCCLLSFTLSYRNCIMTKISVSYHIIGKEYCYTPTKPIPCLLIPLLFRVIKNIVILLSHSIEYLAPTSCCLFRGKFEITNTTSGFINCRKYEYVFILCKIDIIPQRLKLNNKTPWTDTKCSLPLSSNV